MQLLALQSVYNRKRVCALADSINLLSHLDSAPGQAAALRVVKNGSVSFKKVDSEPNPDLGRASVDEGMEAKEEEAENVGVWFLAWP